MTEVKLDGWLSEPWNADEPKRGFSGATFTEHGSDLCVDLRYDSVVESQVVQAMLSLDRGCADVLSIKAIGRLTNEGVYIKELEVIL